MHRHYAFDGEQIIEDAEHRFFHLSCVSGAADQDQLFSEVNRDHGFAAATVARRISPEAWQVNDRVFGNEARQLVSRWPNQQSANKQIVPRKFVDYPNIDPVLRLRSSE